jgi:outer membrane protein
VKNCLNRISVSALSLVTLAFAQAQNTPAPGQTPPQPVASQAKAATGASSTKVGIIHIQNAISGTKDGQRALQELQGKFLPKEKELAKLRDDIQSLREQYQKSANTASEEVRAKYAREIDQKTTALKRDTEDAQTEFDQEQQRLLSEIYQRMQVVIDKYARDNGYTLILDVSSPQTPVLFASNTADLTTDVVALYDKNAPAPGSVSPAAPGSVAPPATGAPKPAPPGLGSTPGTQTTPPAGTPKPGTQTPPPAAPKKPAP